MCAEVTVMKVKVKVSCDGNVVPVKKNDPGGVKCER